MYARLNVRLIWTIFNDDAPNLFLIGDYFVQNLIYNSESSVHAMSVDLSEHYLICVLLCTFEIQYIHSYVITVGHTRAYVEYIKF